MNKIIARGMRDGISQKFEVTLERGKLVIECKTEVLNQKAQELVEKSLKWSIETAEPIANAYHPPENTLLAAYLGLQNRFFDNMPDITIEGELEPIPYEEGVVF